MYKQNSMELLISVVRNRMRQAALRLWSYLISVVRFHGIHDQTPPPPFVLETDAKRAKGTVSQALMQRTLLKLIKHLEENHFISLLYPEIGWCRCCDRLLNLWFHWSHLFACLPVCLSVLYLSISIYLYLYLSVSICIYLYLSVSICIYLYLSLSISIYLYLSLSVSICIYLYLSVSICIYLYLSLSISICIYLYLSVSICIYLYLSLSISIYLSPSLYLSFYLSLSISLYLSLSLFISLYLSISLSLYLSISLSIYLSMYLSIYLSMYLSIYLSGCESKRKFPSHTLNPQADPYPWSILERRWSRPIHTSGSPRADTYLNFDATPSILRMVNMISLQYSGRAQLPRLDQQCCQWFKGPGVAWKARWQGLLEPTDRYRMQRNPNPDPSSDAVLCFFQERNHKNITKQHNILQFWI